MPSVAVGSRNAGPTPQISPAAVGFFGEKKKLCVVCAEPDLRARSPARCRPGSTIGTIVREIRFQFSLIEIGITGWMLR